MSYFWHLAAQARIILTATLVIGVAGPPASAQQLSLTIRDGRVTLDAVNVPVRQVLSEWERVGGVRIVNGDKVTGSLGTLRLADVPERQALDIVLRDVSGYLLAARPEGREGASTFDRILILPLSVAPVRAPSPARGPNQEDPMPRPPRNMGYVTEPQQTQDATDDPDSSEPQREPPGVPRRADAPPPTMIYVPSPPDADPGNPFAVPGAGGPGVVTTQPVNPRIIRPPVTNPDVRR